MSHEPRKDAEEKLDNLLANNRRKPVSKKEEFRILELLSQMGFDLRTADATLLGIKRLRGTGVPGEFKSLPQPTPRDQKEI